jgi:hypothetical protein
VRCHPAGAARGLLARRLLWFPWKPELRSLRPSHSRGNSSVRGAGKLARSSAKAVRSRELIDADTCVRSGGDRSGDGHAQGSASRATSVGLHARGIATKSGQAPGTPQGRSLRGSRLELSLMAPNAPVGALLYTALHQLATPPFGAVCSRGGAHSAH